MYDVTGDSAWLDRYQKAMNERCEKTGKTRLQICEEGYPYDREQIKNIDRALLWIYVSSQGALAWLANSETDENIRTQFRSGLEANARGALAVIDAYKSFDNNDTRVFGPTHAGVRAIRTGSLRRHRPTPRGWPRGGTRRSSDSESGTRPAGCGTH